MNSRTVFVALAFVMTLFDMLLVILSGCRTNYFSLSENVSGGALFAFSAGAVLCGFAAVTMPRDLE